MAVIYDLHYLSFLTFCQLFLDFNFFPGGFYSDTLGYVAEGCKKCPKGSYVAYDKRPGKSVLDCKACPLGKENYVNYVGIVLD